MTRLETRTDSRGHRPDRGPSVISPRADHGAAEALSRSRRIASVLSGIGALLLRTRDRQQLFEGACRVAVEQGGFRCACVGVLDDQGVIRPAAIHGLGEAATAALTADLPAWPAASGAAIVGAMAIRGCADAAAEPAPPPWREALLARGLRAAATMPLCVAGKLAGCLELYSDQDEILDNAELLLLDALAGDISYSMEFFAREISAALSEKHALAAGLRQALERDEFVLHYQPKVNLRTGQICGSEALIRWNRPLLGMIPPSSFVPLLEETGLIVEVGRRVMFEAAREYLRLQRAGLQPQPIAVNVSPLQLRQPDFVAMVREAISMVSGGVAPIELEVTESLLMIDIESTIPKLRAVRDLGVAIAIDDFGTGYSSLAYLSRLPVSAVKIDRSFTMRMTDSADIMSIVSTIITLAHSMDLKVIAEGVDSEEQLKFLRLLKCDQMQGFLFSEGLCGGDFEQLLRRQLHDSLGK